MRLIFWLIGGIQARGTKQPLMPALESRIRLPNEETCDSVFASVENIKPSEVAAAEVHSMIGINNHG